MNTGQCILVWTQQLRSVSTRKQYVIDLTQFFDWAASQGHELMEPAEITRPLCAAWWRELQARYGRETDRGEVVLTVATAQRKFSTLASLLRWCRENGHIQANPADGLIRGRKVRGKPRQAVPLAQVRTLLSWASERANQAGRLVGSEHPGTAHARALAFVLMATVGLRVNEVCSLKVRDFERGEMPTLTVLAKRGKVNRIPVHPATALAIERHIKRLGKGPDGQLAAIPGYAKSHVTHDTVRRWLTEACELTGIPRLTPHQFRSTLATELHLSGVELTSIQRLLGHASVETTARYVHLVDERRQAAALRIDVLGGG